MTNIANPRIVPLGYYLSSVIGRGIVTNNQFKVIVGLTEDALYCIGQNSGPIVGGNTNTDVRHSGSEKVGIQQLSD